MSIISIRIPDNLLKDLTYGAAQLHIQRAAYIRKAIEHLNKEVLNEERKKKLMQASLLVRKNSMIVNKEFSDIEHDKDL